MKAVTLFLFFALISAVFGKSIVRDVHLDTTLVKVEDEVSEGKEHIFIEIDRIEDNLNDDGQLLSERDIRVALRFDVDQPYQVTVNGVPAPLGYSELTVQAQIFEYSDGKTVPFFGELVSVTVRVFIEVGSVTLNNAQSVSAITVQERVVGIQTTEVWQADVIQQVFVVNDDGTITRFETTEVSILNGEPQEPPIAVVDPMPVDQGEGQGEKPHHGHHGGHHQGGHHGGHHQGGHHHGQPEDEKEPEVGGPLYGGEEGKKHECIVTKKVKEFMREAAIWFHSLNFPFRLLVSFAGGMILALVSIAFFKCLARVFCGKKCCTYACKKANNASPANYKENIKVYSLQYTAVPQEEKEKKKEEVTNQIEMV